MILIYMKQCMVHNNPHPPRRLRGQKGKAMRKDLEKKLFDLRFDMDLIGQEDELKKAISCLSDEELIEAIEEQEG